MSSARKRQKATRVAAMIDGANQKAMLERHHANVMTLMAEEIARRHDKLRTVMQQVLADAKAQDVLFEWWPMMEEALGPNDQVQP